MQQMEWSWIKGKWTLSLNFSPAETLSVSRGLMSFGQSIDFLPLLLGDPQHASWSILFTSVDIAIKSRIWCQSSGDWICQELGNQAVWGSKEDECPRTLQLKAQQICFGKHRNMKLVKLQLVRGEEIWSSYSVRYSIIPFSLFLCKSCDPFGEARLPESWRGT